MRDIPKARTSIIYSDHPRLFHPPDRPGAGLLAALEGQTANLVGEVANLPGKAQDPSGAQARRDPRPLPRHVAFPFLTGPLWAPPQSHRRLLARDEGRDRCRTVFSSSASALPAHATSAYGPSGATHVCVSLVADSASNFAGSALRFATRIVPLLRG